MQPIRCCLSGVRAAADPHPGRMQQFAAGSREKGWLEKNWTYTSSPCRITTGERATFTISATPGFTPADGSEPPLQRSGNSEEHWQCARELRRIDNLEEWHRHQEYQPVKQCNQENAWPEAGGVAFTIERQSREEAGDLGEIGAIV